MKRSRSKKPAKSHSLAMPDPLELNFPAIGAPGVAIPGRRKSQKGVDVLSRKKSLRGRPTELDDGQIANRRDRLTQILAAAWGEIGWELQHVEKPQEIAAVLQPLANEREQVLEPFLRFSCVPVDEERMFDLRRQIKELNEPWRKAADAERSARESLATAKRGLEQAQPANLEKIKSECERLEKRAKDAIDHHARFAQTSNDLQGELAPLEAAFAQAQLLDFIMDDRYAFNPYNFARAMAALPYMRWRQSIERCRSKPPLATRGLWDYVFELIGRAIGKADKKSEEVFAQTLKAEIYQFSGDAYIKEFLGDNWFFLHRAVQITCAECTPLPRMPFRIMAIFAKQVHSQSGEDVALAEMEKLPVRREFR